MSSKVNIKEIVCGHIKTLSVAGETKASFVDITTFIITPIALAILSLCLSFNLDKDLNSLLVNFGAIFTALLLSVLVLVYDQENKIESNKGSGELYKVKIVLLQELYYNICYSIIVSVALVVICFIHSATNQNLEDIRNTKSVYDSSSARIIFAHALSAISIFLTSNLILTIIMVVKRMHTLLTLK